jgi:hypothetical protein
MIMKTLTKPRPVRDELIDLSHTIWSERDRGKARPGDTAEDCAEYSRQRWLCEAKLPVWAVGIRHGADLTPFSGCPVVCPCFRRRP